MTARATIRTVGTAGDRELFAQLVREYVGSLPFALDFQDIESELARLEEEYGPPGGRALLAKADGAALGCVAIRPLEPPEVAELKRMYVRPQLRGHGIGLALAEAALAAAAEMGYELVRLDTSAEMVEAAAVYTRLGFAQIGAYRHNPLPTARFYEARLGEPNRARGGTGGPSATPPDESETPH